jgi:pyruvate formate lyase activating enzyme
VGHDQRLGGRAGAGGSLQEAAEHLPQGFRVVRVEQAGHGRLAHDAHDWHLAGTAIAKTLRRMGYYSCIRIIIAASGASAGDASEEIMQQEKPVLGHVDPESTVETRYWHALDDGRVQCDLCPRYCKLREGQRGLCFVRANMGGRVVLTTYGRSSGYCVDPIEKKPLNHFLPGTPVLSFGTAGCNLACKFCQNWDISKSREMDTLMDRADPQTIARAAERLGCASVAYTYNDPIIFHEYAIDVAKACRERGVRSVAVTSGYVCEEPRNEFYEHMDAANVDLKAFTEDFYYKVTGGHLQPVLDTLVYLKHETDVWFETTTLLIPGLNDSDQEIDEMTRWVVRELGPDVPMHFTAFHPDWKILDRPPTPPPRPCAGARHRPAQRCALRLYGQRPRPARAEHLVPPLRQAPDRARRLRTGGMESHRVTAAAASATPPAPGCSKVRPGNGAAGACRCGWVNSARRCRARSSRRMGQAKRPHQCGR